MMDSVSKIKTKHGYVYYILIFITYRVVNTAFFLIKDAVVNFEQIILFYSKFFSNILTFNNIMTKYNFTRLLKKIKKKLKT